LIASQWLRNYERISFGFETCSNTNSFLTASLLVCDKPISRRCVGDALCEQ